MHQRTALITGCGKGGIGHALAAEFSNKGYTVITTVLPHEDQEHLKEIGAHVFASDVTSDSDAASLRASVVKITSGTLDVLVNNAGLVYTMPATDQDIPEVAKMFAVNVFGPMRMVRVFHKMVIASKGTIANISSVAGVVPYIYGSSYNASKAALVAYGNTLRAEMKPFDVRVVNVISGEIRTNILKPELKKIRSLPADSIFEPLAEEFKHHLNRTPDAMAPEEYAKAVVDEIIRRSTRAWFWFGPSTSLVYWYDAFLPKSYWDGLFWKWFSFDKLRTAFLAGRIKSLSI